MTVPAVSRGKHAAIQRAAARRSYRRIPGTSTIKLHEHRQRDTAGGSHAVRSGTMSDSAKIQSPEVRTARRASGGTDKTELRRKFAGTGDACDTSPETVAAIPGWRVCRAIPEPAVCSLRPGNASALRHSAFGRPSTQNTSQTNYGLPRGCRVASGPSR